jgi:hypothetical protein
MSAVLAEVIESRRDDMRFDAHPIRTGVGDLVFESAGGTDLVGAEHLSDAATSQKVRGRGVKATAAPAGGRLSGCGGGI